MGADDYLTKDVSLPHLLARISALFRRVDAAARERASRRRSSSAARCARPEALHAHVEGQRRRAHADRVLDGARARALPRPREEPRAADARRAHRGRRPHHHFAREAHPPQVPGGRSGVRRASTPSTAWATAGTPESALWPARQGRAGRARARRSPGSATATCRRWSACCAKGRSRPSSPPRAPWPPRSTTGPSCSSCAPGVAASGETERILDEPRARRPAHLDRRPPGARCSSSRATSKEDAPPAAPGSDTLRPAGALAAAGDRAAARAADRGFRRRAPRVADRRGGRSALGAAGHGRPALAQLGDARAVILSAAHPIWSGDEVVGAVVVEENDQRHPLAAQPHVGESRRRDADRRSRSARWCCFAFASRLSLRLAGCATRRSRRSTPRGGCKKLVAG